MSNTTTITGNLTREPEIRYTREGQATTQLGVAVSRRWQDRTTQEWQEATSFFDVVCWRDLAENVALSLIQGHARRGDRPHRAAQLGDRRGRAPIQGRDRGRRDRPIPALRHGRRPADRAPSGRGGVRRRQAKPRRLRPEACVPSRVTGLRRWPDPGHKAAQSVAPFKVRHNRAGPSPLSRLLMATLLRHGLSELGEQGDMG